MRFVTQLMLFVVLAAAAATASSENRRVDRHGDRLPHGATARLGTVRFRGLLVHGPDGKSLATRRDNRATLIDPETGAEIRQWAGPDPAELEIWQVLFAPNGRQVAYGELRRVEIWNGTGRRTASIDFDNDADDAQPHGYARPILFSRDSSALVIEQEFAAQSISCWEVKSGECRWKFMPASDQAEDRCRVVGLGPDDNSLIIVNENGTSVTLYVVSFDSGNINATIELGERIESELIVVSPDGRSLIVTYPDGRVGVLRLPDGKHIGDLVRATNRQIVRRFTFSPDNKVIAAATESGVNFYDAQSLKGLATGRHSCTFNLGGLYEPDRLINMFSGDNKSLWCIASDEMKWRRFDTATGREQKIPDLGHRCGVHGISVSNDGRRVVTTGNNEAVCVWNANTSALERRLDGGFRSVFFAGYSPSYASITADGKTIVVLSDSRVILLDVDTGRTRRTINTTDMSSDCAAVNPDGTKIAIADRGLDHDTTTHIRVLSLSTGKQIQKFVNPHNHVAGLAYSPDGQWLFAEGSSLHGEQCVSVLDANSGRQLRRYDTASGGVAVHPFANLLVFGGESELFLRELGSDGDRLKIPLPTADTFDLLAVSPDGRILAGANNGAGSRKIYLWELQTGTALPSLIGHNHNITALTFMPDGRLISGSWDTTALIWEMPRLGNPTLAPITKAEEWSKAWNDLAGDAPEAHTTLERLVISGPATCAWLTKHLKPAAPVDPTRIQKALEQLNSDRFADRRRATIDLEQCDLQAEPLIRKHLDAKVGAEARQRTRQLLERLENPLASPFRLREQRCLELLQRLGDESAKAFLKELADGDPSARLTQSARRILQRMNKTGS